MWVGTRGAAQRLRHELVPEARGEYLDAGVDVHDGAQEEAQVGYPRVRIVAAVVAAGDDEAGVGVELGRRGALVVPASEVFPARNERRGRRRVRRGSIGRVLAERRLVGSRVRGAPSLARA